MTNKAGIGTLITEEHELATSALDLFSIPPIEATQLGGQEQTVYLNNPLTNEGPYEFLVVNNSTDFIMLDQTCLCGEVEILGANNAKVKEANKNISVVNNFPQALFKQVEVYLNNTCVTDLSTPSYPFKAYLENHLSYGNDVKDTTLRAKEMFMRDEAGKEGKDMADFADFKGTDGLTKRAIAIRNKISFNMKLHVDILGSVRYLLPGVEMKIKLIRSDDKFPLISTDDSFKIHFRKLELKIRRITLTPNIAAAIENKLQSEPARYPIALSKIKTHSIPTGTSSAQISQIIRGKLPRSFFFGFVAQDAYDGVMSKNPFMFQHFKLSQLNVYINGTPIHPMPLTPKWDNNECVPEYTRFLDNIGLHQNHSNGITLEDFKTNTLLFCYDLSPDLCNSFYKHAPEEGTIDVSLSFGSALTENINLVFFSTYDETVLIDKDRNVVMTI